MAFTPAALTKGHQASGTAHDTASIAPASDALVFLWVKAIDSAFTAVPTFSSISGNGLTWTEVITFTVEGVTRYSVYSAKGTSPSAGAVTITRNIDSILVYNIIEIASDAGSPVAVQAVQNQSTAATTLTATLAAFADAANRPVGFAGGEEPNTALGEDDWTQIDEYNVDFGGFNNTLSSSWKNSVDTTFTATQASSAHLEVVAIEVGVSPGYTEVNTTVAGDDVLILVPDAPHAAGRCIMFHHGRDWDEQRPLTSNFLRFAERWAEDGYYVACANLGGNTWGSDASRVITAAFHDYMESTYGITGYVVASDSMGGISGLLSDLDSSQPLVRGWLGFDAVCSLANIYAPAGVAKDDINTVYDIPGGGSYATQTAGHDPALFASSAFAAKRFRIYDSSTDTLVPPDEHGDVLSALALSGGALEAGIVRGTHDHGDASAIDIEDVMDFVARCFTYSHVDSLGDYPRSGRRAWRPVAYH
jgi:hypothetical protein